MESKNGNPNVITFVSTSYIFFIRITLFLPLSAFHFFLSFFFISKNSKSNKQTVQKRNDIKCENKKENGFSCVFLFHSYCSPLPSSFDKCQKRFYEKSRKEIAKIFRQSSKVSRNFLKPNF